MPCYLFTWHAYATWMPDRKQGFVRKKQGILPPDAALADEYRSRQKEATAEFDVIVQKLTIEEALVASGYRRFRLHAAATDRTHMHLLLSWQDDRVFEKLRRGLRESISRRLNAHLPRRWLEQGGSRRRVCDQKHFDYLKAVYFPKHRGWKWDEERGFYL